MIAGLMMLGAPLALVETPDVATQNAVEALSADWAFAQGRDACAANRSEIRRFDQRYGVRLKRVEASLAKRYGPGMAGYGVYIYIPEACRHYRTTSLAQRTVRFERSLAEMEHQLGLAQ